MTRHLGWLAGILLLTVALYVRVSGAPLCSYDDYLEVHRAAFEDSHDPARVFTTPHFGTFKYRPFNRGLNLLSYRMGGGAAAPFRVRNLAFHLIDVLLVAALAGRLLRSTGAGTLAAALFAVHPLADQTVIGSVMTNTAAHGLLLAGLLCWVKAFDEPDASGALPVLGIALAGASLLFYDSAITFFPIVALWALVVATTRGWRAIPPRHAMVFVLGSLIVMALYLGLRARFVPAGFGAAAADRASLGSLVHNTALYGVAMMVPLDPVLANTWFHAPLPSELGGAPGAPGVIAALAIASVLVTALLVIGWWPRRDRSGPGLPVAGFLVGAIALSLAPVLILSSHASETYVYLPMAFVAMLAAQAITRLWVARPAVARLVVVGVLALACCATVVRNERVLASGLTARRILDSLPAATLARGEWRVTLADVPGEARNVRYGFYGFQGTGTIGSPPHADQALTCALQLRFRNEALQGRVLDARALAAKCDAGASAGELMAWVHHDGRLETCTHGVMPHE